MWFWLYTVKKEKKEWFNFYFVGQLQLQFMNAKIDRNPKKEKIKKTSTWWTKKKINKKKSGSKVAADTMLGFIQFGTSPEVSRKQLTNMTIN